ncbi:MAG: class I SAM-dependent methyltransferase [Gemmatimonadaceae bacterium]
MEYVMRLDGLQQTWDALGAEDPMWAILTDAAKKGQKWNRDEFFATGRAQVADLLRSLAALEGPVAFGRALDVGCGIGRVTQALAAHYDQVEGVDIAPSMIARADAENTVGPRVTYRLVAGADLAHIPSGTIDLVWSVIVLQHMPPPVALAYLREFVRVLSLEGVAVFQIPTRIPFREAIKHWLPPLAWAHRTLFRRGRPVMAMHVIPARTVARTVEVAGGSIVREEAGRDGAHEWITYYVRRRGEILSRA